MEPLVEKGKMQILAAGLSKGFTILEILIALLIISIASGSFYLLLRDPIQIEPLKSKIKQYSELSMYTGNIYGVKHDGFYLSYEDKWILREEFESNYIDSIKVNNKDKPVLDDQIYLFIYPGNELSTEELILENGEKIEL